jgi:hypothetical protein
MVQSNGEHPQSGPLLWTNRTISSRIVKGLEWRERKMPLLKFVRHYNDLSTDNGFQKG